MSYNAKNDALAAEAAHRTAVESANDYIENFDILETITNVGNDEVFTPRKIVEQVLDMLPDEVWHNPDYKWLNPATKNGVFEREIAIRLDKGLENTIQNVEKRRKHILQNMIFAIGETLFTSNVARRTLYYCSQANRKCDGIKARDGHYLNGFAIGNGTWFDTPDGNISTPRLEHDFRDVKDHMLPEHLNNLNILDIENNPKLKIELDKYSCRWCGIKASSKYNSSDQIEHYAYDFIHIDPMHIEEYLQKLFFNGDKNMKFDVIIGNPPYQLDDGGGNGASAKPIYHFFVKNAKKLHPKYITMITPSRWFAGGKGLDDYRDEMLHDNRLRVIHDYPTAADCFTGVQIKGGVSFFLWCRDSAGDCKIYSHKESKVLGPAIRPLLENGCDTFIRYNEAIPILHKVQKFNEASFESLVSVRMPFGLPSTFKGHTSKTDATDLTVYVSGNDRDVRGTVAFVSKEEIKKGAEMIAWHKVYISKAGSGSDDFPHPILTRPFYGAPGTACNESYLVIGRFESKEECNNVISYISTKFFRFLVLLKKNSQNAPRNVYSLVPKQAFNKPWTDKELYIKYGLSDEEIAFIESMIKPME